MLKPTILLAVAIVASQATPPATQTPQPSTAAAQPTTPPRPASPAGTAATQVLGQYVKDAKGRERYQGGKWIEISYGRPILRQRSVFGSGADYGKALYAGGPIWRAGANVSTRLNTEVPLQIGDKTVPAGEYSLFIELKSEKDWTLVVSSYGAKKTGGDQTPDTLWGAFNYKPDKDVARVAMTVGKLPFSVDQLTWSFADMTAKGGKLALMWDTVVATAPFTVQ